MSLPRILMIDDQCGWGKDVRTNICTLFGLIDHTPGYDAPVEIDDPVAEVEICPGQIREGNRILNSLELVEEAVRRDCENWALILVDLRFVSGDIEGDDMSPCGEPDDDGFGLEIVAHIKKHYPEIPLLILSAMNRKAYEEAAIERGAADFLPRTPLGSDDPCSAARSLLRDRIRKHGLIGDDRGIIIGKSYALKEMLCKARKAISGMSTLLIGERGAGKDLLARYIHDMSSRRDAPFIPVNCAAFTESLLESELFGHEKGAFTGAEQARKGIFEIANGGTVFLDEIGIAPPSVQVKLLRILEERCVAKVGSSQIIDVDLHVVFATNRDLSEEVQRGTFLPELLDRINAYRIDLPSLHERINDIPMIAQAIIDQLCKAQGAQPRTITNETLKKLVAYKWPGNIRELKNVLDQAIRNYPDVNHLVDSHIDLEKAQSDNHTLPNDLSKLEIVNTQHTGAITALNLSKDNHDSLAGRLEDVLEQNLERICIYLNKCLELTRKSSGEINITAAAKLMTGDRFLKKMKAADLIKRCLKAPSEMQVNVLQKFPIVQKALSNAEKTRGGRKKLTD